MPFVHNLGQIPHPPPCFLQHKMEQQTLMVFGGAYVSGPLGYMCVSPRL